MALRARVQAACLLLLLLASLADGSALRQETLPQTGQLAALQPQDTAARAQAGLTPVLRRLRKRDTHFPVCVFCCGCCNNVWCGLCCKT